MTMPDVREYHVVWRSDGETEWYECPLCGRLDGAVLRGHGQVHVTYVQVPPS